MRAPRVDIISIGCLSRNRLWNESEAARTAHATTSLIRAAGRTILVDPGLPAAVLAARLNERTGLLPEAVDTVFLTNFRLAHRRGIDGFPKARWLIHEKELDFERQRLQKMRDESPESDEDHRYFAVELELLDRFEPAEDRLAEGIDLFPLPGYTPGTCGILVASATLSILIAGDAVPTLDHFLAGQALPDSANIRDAHEAMREVYEIADVIVPGHDNLFVNPRMIGA
ncbi:MAG: MBL fold metallo-hydrolase [Phycisphaerae bacterium]|nr:MBL fold metallo-hydrolase [Phycisphaerae bacterium]MDW8262828.1 MBL fold metallo-hydrolase [Phycisphaerales bacterium]